MRKIIFRKLLIIFIIASVFIPLVAYAIDVSTQENLIKKEFFYMDKNQASQGEEIIMNIDLSKIEYDNFEFTLSSDIDLKQISTQKEEINTKVEDNEFKIVSSKSNINMEKISLYYKIPEEMQIGSTIKLVGKIKEYVGQNNENEEESQAENNESLEEISKSEEQEVIITITIVENSDEENNKEEISDKISQNQNQSQGQSENKTQIQNQAMQTIQTSVKTSNSLSNQETITYNGESNNYLNSLTIDGYELTPIFSKTNNTYFINVEKDVTSIKIETEVEDENAKVKIYGNEDLQEGENKVLISVTAENGEVRRYRIYVTK